MKTKLVFGGMKKHGKIVTFLLLIMLNSMETLYLEHFKSIQVTNFTLEEMSGLTQVLQTVFSRTNHTSSFGLKLLVQQLETCTIMTTQWTAKIHQPSQILDSFLNSVSNPNPPSLHTSVCQKNKITLRTLIYFYTDKDMRAATSKWKISLQNITISLPPLLLLASKVLQTICI